MNSSFSNPDNVSRDRVTHVPMSEGGHHPHEEGHGHGGTGKYWIVFGALCLLTGISVFTQTEYWPLSKEASHILMIGVSCAKALLVILFFMHTIWEANWKYVLTIPASLMSLFLIAMLVPDIGFRTSHYSLERWERAPAALPTVEHLRHLEHEANHSHDEEHAH